MTTPKNASLGAVSTDAHATKANIKVEAIEVDGRWSVEKANAWYRAQPWLIGCNYLPASTINQLEMWQEESFDLPTIQKELGWAKELGFNTLRVYLHDLVWGANPQGLYDRMDQFLACAQQHDIRVIFVFFDDCHRPFPELGAQPSPVAEYHNSGWMNSPARDIAIDYSAGTASAQNTQRLEGYLKQTMQNFADDDRILLWELYNEPGREYQLDSHMEEDWFGDLSAQLLLDAWKWAREANPIQPICSTAEGSVGEINIALAKLNSDVFSFHSYGPPDELESLCEQYANRGRATICTEYMARPNSTFQGSLPVLKKHHIGAINWGFVSGKSGTIWPWSSKNGKDVRRPWDAHRVLQPGEALPEPELWFHDIYRIDGSPFDPEEITFIKSITSDQA